MSNKYIITTVILLIILVSVFLVWYVNRTPSYGKVISFEYNVPIQFPDFTIKYVGQEKTKVDFNPNLIFIDLNFLIIDNKNNSQTISWSSGTGVIMPTSFKIQDRTFSLELVYSSVTRSHLKTNEFVITPEI